jgi:small-conductance mechanosensitive channel
VAASNRTAANLSWRELPQWFAANSTDILLAFGAGLLIAILLIGLRGLGRRLLGGTGALGWRGIVAQVLVRTNLFFIVMAAARIVSLQTDMPRRLADGINILFIVAAALQVAVWTRTLIIGAIDRKVGANEENRTLGTAMGLIRVLVTVAAFLIAIIVILDNVGVNVTGLIAGLGIGGIAIGLAAQGIFKDLFAAVAIIFDRPFQKGDTISFGGATGITGTVENIGLRTTRLRALDGEMVAVGNDKLLQDRVHNFAVQSRRRAVMTISVMPHTTADQVARLPEEIRAIVTAQPQVTFDRAHAIRFGLASIDLELVFWMETADFAAFVQARHEIIVALLRRLEEMGVEIAPPLAPPVGPPSLGKSQP